jgi:hypothetical protein
MLENGVDQQGFPVEIRQAIYHSPDWNLDSAGKSNSSQIMITSDFLHAAACSCMQGCTLIRFPELAHMAHTNPAKL